MSARLIRIAALYLVVGVAMGIVMGITQKFTLVPVHAHINLLGWASLGIMGVIYHAYPAAAQTLLARASRMLPSNVAYASRRASCAGRPSSIAARSSASRK
jgi:hypothetical protein